MFLINSEGRCLLLQVCQVSGYLLYSSFHWWHLAFTSSLSLLFLCDSPPSFLFTRESALNYTCLPRVSQMWLKHNLHSWHIKHLISSCVNDCGCVIWVVTFFQITWIVCNYLADACIWNLLQSILRLPHPPLIFTTVTLSSVLFWLIKYN